MEIPVADRAVFPREGDRLAADRDAAAVQIRLEHLAARPRAAPVQRVVPEDHKAPRRAVRLAAEVGKRLREPQQLCLRERVGRGFSAGDLALDGVEIDDAQLLSGKIPVAVSGLRAAVDRARVVIGKILPDQRRAVQIREASGLGCEVFARVVVSGRPELRDAAQALLDPAVKFPALRLELRRRGRLVPEGEIAQKRREIQRDHVRQRLDRAAGVHVSGVDVCLPAGGLVGRMVRVGDGHKDDARRSLHGLHLLCQREHAVLDVVRDVSVGDLIAVRDAAHRRAHLRDPVRFCTACFLADGVGDVLHGGFFVELFHQ